MDSYDVIVIGMGVGGEEVAGQCAEAGLNVLGVEKNLAGGECPYWGCIPSKMMVRAATALAEAGRVNELAGSSRTTPDWRPVADRVRDATANWDDTAAVERFEKKGGSFLRGAARLVSPTEIEVAGRRFSAARGIAIASGGAPAVPPIEGIDTVDVWTNREAIEATELPVSAVVLGAGPVGLELAQTFHRFGCEITIVEMGDHALPAEEPENGEAMGKVIEADGMKLFTGISADKFASVDGGVEVSLSDGSSVAAERLLVATGRRSDLESVGVRDAGLEPKGGAIQVDEHCRAAPGIWAVGDVTGRGGFTHVAVYQGRIAAADIIGRDHAPADYTAVPRVTFTDPEVAGVGMTEAEARDRGLKTKPGVAKTSSSTRGWIHGPGAEHGVIKLIADAEAGVLVGGSVMGPPAGEIIGFLGLAIREKIPVANLTQLIYPYPTFVRGLEDALRELG